MDNKEQHIISPDVSKRNGGEYNKNEKRRSKKEILGIKYPEIH